jgi:hypothetical protein
MESSEELGLNVISAITNVSFYCPRAAGADWTAVHHAILGAVGPRLDDPNVEVRAAVTSDLVVDGALLLLLLLLLFLSLSSSLLVLLLDRRGDAVAAGGSGECTRGQQRVAHG